MSLQRLRPLAAMAAAAMLLVACGPSLPAGVSKTDMPGALLDENVKLPFTQGQKLNYKMTVQVDGKPFETTGTGEVTEVTADAAKLQFKYKGADGAEAPAGEPVPIAKLLFQLKPEAPGKTANMPDGGVVSWEKVTVAAGDYDCTKIASKDGTTMWLSTTAGLVKIITPAGTFELTK